MRANATFGRGSSEKVLRNKQDLTRQKARVKGVQGKVEKNGNVVLYINIFLFSSQEVLTSVQMKNGLRHWGRNFLGYLEGYCL